MKAIGISPIPERDIKALANRVFCWRCVMKIKQIQIGWGFWLWWVLASTIGWFVGVFWGFVLGSIIVEDVIEVNALGFTLAYSIFGAVLGSVVGLTQWFVLRQRVSRTVSWILASAAGFAVAEGGGYGAAVLAFSFSTKLDEMGVGWILVAAFGGAVTGILQWPILRGQVSRAGWWVLASTMGWGLSMAVGVAGFEEWQGQESLEVLSLVGGGIVLGAVTGGALVWLLRKPLQAI
jgi:hypothetical protein